MTKRKIKPCPFCGGEVDWWAYDRGSGAGLFCHECEMDFGSSTNEKEERAVEAKFNQRAPAK